MFYFFPSSSKISGGLDDFFAEINMLVIYKDINLIQKRQKIWDSEVDGS